MWAVGFAAVRSLVLFYNRNRKQPRNDTTGMIVRRDKIARAAFQNIDRMDELSSVAV